MEADYNGVWTPTGRYNQVPNKHVKGAWAELLTLAGFVQQLGPPLCQDTGQQRLLGHCHQGLAAAGCASSSTSPNPEGHQYDRVPQLQSSCKHMCITVSLHSC